MNNNPFSDLIPRQQSGANPFADLVPRANPYNDEGASWSEQPKEIDPWLPTPERNAAFAAQAQQPKPPVSLTDRVVDAYTRAANDPGGAFFGAVGKIGERVGLLDKGAEEQGTKFGRALVNSMGPLGVEFVPLASVPRVPKPAAAKPQPMPRGSVRAEAELRATGGARMGEAKQSEATVGPDVMQSSVAKFRDDLNKLGLEVDADLHPTAAKVMRKLEEAIAEPRTLGELHRLRQKVQTVIENGVKPNGSANQEGLIGQKMKVAVDDMIAAHPEGAKFKQGTSEYARAEKSALITETLEKAKNTAQWQRGDQAGAIRNAVKPLLNNKRYKNYWSKEERKALAKVRAFGTLEALGGLGSTGYAGFTLGRVAEVAMGLPPGVTFPFGFAARQSINASKTRALEAVAEMVRAGGPVAQSRVSKVSELFSPKVFEHLAGSAEGAKRIAAWAASPTPQTARALASYTSAKLGMPQLTQRIMAELQGTEQTQADQ